MIIIKIEIYKLSDISMWVLSSLIILKSKYWIVYIASKGLLGYGAVDSLLCRPRTTVWAFKLVNIFNK